MPEGRFVSKSIATSEQLASVSFKADFVFGRCLPHLDVEGRMPGNPRTIKAITCPLRDEITIRGIGDCIAELVNAELVLWYEVDGIQVLAFPQFRRHQRGLKTEREAPSKLPPYSGPTQDLVGRWSDKRPPKVSKGELSQGKESQEEVSAQQPLSPVSGVTVEVPEPYAPHLASLLSRVAEPLTWQIEMRAMIDRTPGHHHPTPEQLGRAIRDFMANGCAQHPSLRQFRRYVEGAIAEKNGTAPRGGRRNAGEESYERGKRALQDIRQ
jgi:hypothetical protein